MALKIGVVPAMGFKKASKMVIVINEVATPLAVTGPVPAMVVVVFEAGPAVNVTVPPVLVIGVTSDKVLTSAFVDRRVQVEIPDELVALQVP